MRKRNLFIILLLVLLMLFSLNVKALTYGEILGDEAGKAKSLLISRYVNNELDSKVTEVSDNSSVDEFLNKLNGATVNDNNENTSDKDYLLVKLVIEGVEEKHIIVLSNEKVLIGDGYGEPPTSTEYTLNKEKKLYDYVLGLYNNDLIITPNNDNKKPINEEKKTSKKLASYDFSATDAIFFVGGFLLGAGSVIAGISINNKQGNKKEN